MWQDTYLRDGSDKGIIWDDIPHDKKDLVIKSRAQMNQLERGTQGTRTLGLRSNS